MGIFSIYVFERFNKESKNSSRRFNNQKGHVVVQTTTRLHFFTIQNLMDIKLNYSRVNFLSDILYHQFFHHGWCLKIVMYRVITPYCYQTMNDYKKRMCFFLIRHGKSEIRTWSCGCSTLIVHLSVSFAKPYTLNLELPHTVSILICYTLLSIKL